MAAIAGYSSIKVSWTAPGSNGVAVTGYRASASPGPATCMTGPHDSGCVLGAEAGTAYTVSVVALAAGGSSPAAKAAGQVVPLAPVVGSTPPDTDLPLGTGNGPISSAAPGQTLVVTGHGYAPYSSVTLTVYSSPRTLGTVQADRTGAFAQAVRVPARLPAGTHSFVATGVDRSGRVRALRLDLTVAASGGGGPLPITGPAVVWLIVGGFALALAGVALRAGASRRSPGRLRP